jgi:hypothetical protein
MNGAKGTEKISLTALRRLRGPDWGHSHFPTWRSETGLRSCSDCVSNTGLCSTRTIRLNFYSYKEPLSRLVLTKRTNRLLRLAVPNADSFSKAANPIFVLGPFSTRVQKQGFFKYIEPIELVFSRKAAKGASGKERKGGVWEQKSRFSCPEVLFLIFENENKDFQWICFQNHGFLASVERR